jgi:hypothetical protein
MTNAQSCWKLERRGSIALLAFERPPINMLSFVAVGALPAARGLQGRHSQGAAAARSACRG